MNFFINTSLLRRNSNFRLLFLGQFISFFGTMITNVALPYQIYHMTESTLMVGLLSLFQLLPLLVTALLGGVLADKYPRRALLLLAESTLTIGCLLLALNAFAAAPKIWVLFVVAFFMSALNGLHRPALESITQQIVDRADYAMVGALVTFKFSVCMIIGPAIGGLLIARFGVGITYIVDFFSFLVSVIALLMMSSFPKPVCDIVESTWVSIKQGFRYAASRQELLGSYFVDFAAMVFGMPIALFPAIAQHHGGPKTLGLLYSAPAVGALIVSFFSGWTMTIKRHGAGIAVAAAFWGVSIIFFGLSHELWWALFFLAWAGAFDAISGIFRQTLWNETIPQEFRGRLAGIEMISYLSGPKLGDTEAGLVAAAFGTTFSIISGGVLCLVGVGVCCFYLPKFWRYESTVVRQA
jgi:MFS family permease